MKTIKIKSLSAKTPEEIAKITEAEANKVRAFASPILFAKDKFVSFIYYEDDKKLEGEKPKPFSSNLITDKQIGMLKKLHYKGTFNLTKFQASKQIDALLKKHGK